MAPFDLATSAEWTPFAYTSACEVLKDFAKEAKKAPEASKPFLTDLETIFEVRHSWRVLATVCRVACLHCAEVLSPWCKGKLPKVYTPM